jgi:hypothetical protein
MEAVEEAADLGTLLFRVRTKLTGELGAEVAVGETVHGVLPTHERDEQLIISVQSLGALRRSPMSFATQRENSTPPKSDGRASCGWTHCCGP